MHNKGVWYILHLKKNKTAFQSGWQSQENISHIILYRW